MPVPSDITALSAIAASNSPAGSESPATADDYFRAHAAFIAQLRAVIGGAANANIPNAYATIAQVNDYVANQSQNSGTTGGTSTAYTLTPATAITSYAANKTFWVKFHVASGASPTIQISGISSPPTLVRQSAAGTYAAIGAGEIPAGHLSRVTLLSATQALVEDMPPAIDCLNTTRIDVASAATVNLTSSAPNTRNINITGTTTTTGFTIAAGLNYFVRFNAALTLTNNANIVTQTGVNITTAAGDTCIIRATAANTVEVLSYVPAASLLVHTSSDMTGTSGGLLTVTHSLGVVPDTFVGLAVCSTAEFGFSPSDTLGMPVNFDNNGTATLYGVQVQEMTSTTYKVRVGNGLIAAASNKSSFAAVTPSLANWKIRITCKRTAL